MENPVIKTDQLTKKYSLYTQNIDRLKEALHPFNKKYHKDFYALRNIDIEIFKGQTVGIIGQNGSGKSTLLKIISGILKPTTGSFKVNGKISALLELGTGFNPELTGIENVYFNGTIIGYSKKEIEKKLNDIVTFADIGEFIHQKVKTYSTGMFVRLAFSVAINVDPDILIIDEALAVGDAHFQIKCMNRMRGFKESGKTIIFVSHDPGAIRTLCDYAYLLDAGNVIDAGSPDRVLDYYNSLLSLKKQKTELSLMDKRKKDELRKRTGNKQIEIVDVKLLNKKGISSDTLVSGETISIRILVVANETVKNPTFGIAIRDRLGNNIYGINNYLLQKNTGVLEKGLKYYITYTFSLNLGINIYNLTVATHTDENHIDQCYDWINNIIAFKVIPSPEFKFEGYCRIIPSFEINKYKLS